MMCVFFYLDIGDFEGVEDGADLAHVLGDLRRRCTTVEWGGGVGGEGTKGVV